MSRLNIPTITIKKEEGLTKKDLVNFMKHLTDFPDDIPINLVVTSTDNDEDKCRLLIADYESINFYNV